MECEEEWEVELAAKEKDVDFLNRNVNKPLDPCKKGMFAKQRKNHMYLILVRIMDYVFTRRHTFI